MPLGEVRRVEIEELVSNRGELAVQLSEGRVVGHVTMVAPGRAIPTWSRNGSDWVSELHQTTIAPMRIRKQLPALFVALSLFTVACGDGDSGATTSVPEATTTTAAADTTTTAAQQTTTTAGEATTTTAGEDAGIVAGEDPEVDAVVEVYRVVFDSSTSFEEKSVFIDDPSGLEDTVTTYQTTGDSVGGVTAEPTEVTIDGENAAVVYTLFFSGNPTYPGQDGTAVLTDEGWKVTREMFCGVMASARSACPTD